MLKWLFGEEVTIQFRGQKIKGSTKKTILHSVIENKTKIRHNCGSGVCGQCAVKVITGEINSPTKITLACQTYPKSDITIEQ